MLLFVLMLVCIFCARVCVWVRVYMLDECALCVGVHVEVSAILLFALYEIASTFSLWDSFQCLMSKIIYLPTHSLSLSHTHAHGIRSLR